MSNVEQQQDSVSAINYCLVLASSNVGVCCSRLAEHLEEYIPNLESLILTGNQLEELSDIDPLVTLENLTSLSLLHNPITAKPHYRLYVIYKLPQLRLLDFRKIRTKEKDEAKALFKSKKGKEIQKEISKRAKMFVPGGNLPNVAKSKGKNHINKLKFCVLIAFF